MKSYENLKPYYNQYKYVYQKTIKLAKKKFYINKIETAINKSKTVWGILNTETKPNNKNKIHEIQIGNKIEQNQIIANHFNKYFVEIPSNITKNIKSNHTANNHNKPNIKKVTNNLSTFF